MTERRRLLALLASAGIGSFAGCGSQDGGDTTTGAKSAESDSTPTRTTTATTTPTATLTPTSIPTSTDTPTSTEAPTPTEIPSQTESENIVATDGDSDDGFGGSVGVAADGSTAVIGATSSAYVFIRTGREWQQQAKLVPNSGDSRVSFAESVGVSANGNTAIIGAYVFTRTDGNWQQQAKLFPNNSINNFGGLVEISDNGNTAVIGAPSEERQDQAYRGSTYVFTQTGKQWQQQAKLVPDNSGVSGSCDVAADGSTIAIGGDSSGDGGAASIFTLIDGEWQQQTTLAPQELSSRDQFGRSVGLSADGSTAVIGAPSYDSLDGVRAGLAYVFSRTGGNWQEQARLAPDDSNSDDFFGFVGVTADGNSAVIGAPGDEEPNGRFSGSAYVFRKERGEWQPRAKLVASDGDNEDQFGILGVSGSGNTVVIGATLDDNSKGEDAGSAYVFSLDTEN